MQERDTFDPTMIGRPIHAVWEPLDAFGEYKHLELMGVLEYVTVNGDDMAVGVKTGIEKTHNGWTGIDMARYMLTVRVVV